VKTLQPVGLGSYGEMESSRNLHVTLGARLVSITTWLTFLERSLCSKRKFCLIQTLWLTMNFETSTASWTCENGCSLPYPGIPHVGWSGWILNWMVHMTVPLSVDSILSPCAQAI